MKWRKADDYKISSKLTLLIFNAIEICAHRLSHSFRLSRPKDRAFSDRAIFNEILCIKNFFALAMQM